MTKCHSSVSVPTELVPVLPDEASPVAGVRTVAAAGAKLVEVDQLAVDMKHYTVQISEMELHGSTTGCTITEKAPTRAFSWLKAPTSAFTFNSLLPRIDIENR